MADTYDAEIFYRNGKAMVRYPDGDEAAYADVMKYMNPSVDFDPNTGEALGPAAPPIGRSEAEVRAGAKTEPQRRRDQDTFGDTTMRMAAPYLDSAIELAANAGRRPTYFSDPIMGGLERAGQYTGDMALAALSGLGALTYGGAGLMGEVFGGSQSDERMLARDLAAGIDVSGVGPEARALGFLSDAVRAERGGVGNMTRGFLADESGSVPLPFKADDPAQARGAQIIDMLTSGRAGEITDQMLDMGDPVLNANLNQYLFRNYDLPMDSASRVERAQKMRSGTDAFHATTADFQAFDPLMRGTATDAGWFGNADYFSPSSQYVEKFVSSTDKNPSIMPVRLNRGNVYDWRAMEADRGGRGLGNNADAAFQTRARLESEGFNSVEVSNPIIKTDAPISDEMWSAMKAADPSIEGLGRENVSKSFQSGIPRRSLEDYFTAEMLDLLPAQKVIDEIAIFDPRNIRSRFARFDPRLAHLRNLSAGIAPFGLLALQPNEEQY